MNWIIFYISNHGFGHLTRSISIIEEVMKESYYSVSLVCGENHIDFAKLYLAKYKNRIEFRIVDTDVGLICKKDSLEVDIDETELNINRYLYGLGSLVQGEYDFYKGRSIKSIAVDISIAGIYLGKKLGVKTGLITNFTWCQQYEYLGIDKTIIGKFKEAYKEANQIIEYDISLDLKEYNDNIIYTGVLAREVDRDRVKEIKEKYGPIFMVSCGQSVNLKNIKISNFEGTIIKTRGIDVVSDSPIVELGIDTRDTQNYVAASDIILAKAGWGTIGEGLVGHTPMLLMERDVREDREMTEILKERNLALSISTDEMQDIDYNRWKDKIKEEVDFDKLNMIKSCANDIAKILID